MRRAAATIVECILLVSRSTVAVVVLPPGVDRARYARGQAANYQSFDGAAVMAFVSRATAELGVAIDPTPPARMGMIESSNDAAYLATYTVATADTGFAGPVAGITAVTAISGMPVFITLSCRLTGTSTYDELLAEAMVAIGNFISASSGIAN